MAQIDQAEIQSLLPHRYPFLLVDRIKELEPWFHGEFVVVLKDGTKLTSSAAHSKDLHRLVDKSSP